MKLDYEELTQQEAADNLKVRVNGQPWRATRVRIVRRKEGDRTQWVHMIIVDQNGMQLEYFMERLTMIFAWKALYENRLTQKEIDDLTIELNGSRCKAIEVTSVDEGDDTWIEMEIECLDGMKQKISIEMQSMINAYYALRTGVEDMFEVGLEILTKTILDM